MDEILLLEIERLKQMLFIAAKDISNLDGSNKFDYLHDLSTRDYFEEVSTIKLLIKRDKALCYYIVLVLYNGVEIKDSNGINYILELESNLSYQGILNSFKGCTMVDKHTSYFNDLLSCQLAITLVETLSNNLKGCVNCEMS